MNNDKLPTVKHYAEFLDKASKLIGISIDEARKRFGQYTYGEWYNMFFALDSNKTDTKTQILREFNEQLNAGVTVTISPNSIYAKLISEIFK